MSCVTREVTLPLDSDEAWETVAELSEWLVEDADLSLEAGEEGTLRLADGEERHAVVEDVEPGERLTFWWWAGDEPPTHVELTLEPAVGGTRVVVVESGYAAGPVMFAGAAAMGPVVFAGAATGVGVTGAASPLGVAGGTAGPGVAGAPPSLAPSLGIACAALPRLLAAGALVPA